MLERGSRLRPRRDAPDGSGPAGQPQLFREWIGGRFPTPFFVHDREEPYRPDIVIWVELPEGFIVGQAVVMPDDAGGAVARTLRSALTQPLVGPPRRPDLIRVADGATAVEVRAEVAGAIPVNLAPTPELEALVDQMVASLQADADDGDDAPSYFAWGRVSPAAVEKLFNACRSLFAAKPWTIAGDTQVLRMDIPALDVDGACVSILGALGEVHGLAIFPSMAAFDRYLEDTATGAFEEGAGPGVELLLLRFDAATKLPPSMRREAMEHGWPVAGPDAYPLVERREPDGAPRPLVERDVAVAAAAARSISAFFATHSAIFESDTPAPVCESYRDDDDREVRLTASFVAELDYDLTPSADPVPGAGFAPPAPAEPFRPRAGRNDPCPCGSGRKYKKCHLAADEADHAGRDNALAMHELDRRLATRLARFALDRFGERWQAFQDDFADPHAAASLAGPWSVYGFEVDGRTVADAYRAARGRCSPQERAWMEAQRTAWLSVWEIEAVEPGKTLALRDLLSDERRTVHETQASQLLARRHAVLGRVVDHDGQSLLCGTHPRPLPPFHAAEVVRRARGRLRRRRAVPVERLRDASLGRYLIRRWEEAVEDCDARGALPRDLRNQDGDPLLFTVDRFEVTPAAVRAVDTRIAGIDGAWQEPSDGDSATWTLVRPDPTGGDGDGIVVGRVKLHDTDLRVETNSKARADTLRERIEAACGARIRHRAREHADPAALMSGAEKAPREPASPEEERVVAEFKARHYADWADRPLPALKGRTPRECVRTAAGRRMVELLLKDMEHREHRSSERPFDFSTIRRDLDLPLD